MPEMPGDKPSVVRQLSRAAIAQDLYDGHKRIVKDVECLFIWADPEKGESIAAGEYGWLHNPGVKGSKDKIFSIVVPALQKKFWTELNGTECPGTNPKTGGQNTRRFNIEPVLLDFDVSLVEAEVVEGAHAFLGEVLLFMNKAIYIGHPRTGAPIQVRSQSGLHDTLIFPEGFLERFGDTFKDDEEAAADAPAPSFSTDTEGIKDEELDKRCCGTLVNGTRCTRKNGERYHNYYFCMQHKPQDENQFRLNPEKFVYGLEEVKV